MQHRSILRLCPSLSFGLVIAFLAVLWLAGGASRAEAAGQLVVRAAACATAIVAILFGVRRASRAVWPLWFLLGAALLLTLLQLVPLPHDVWQMLPGREPLAEAGWASGPDRPWRPWSIVPGATANAAFSLVVPIALLVLLTGLRDAEHARLPGVLLGMLSLSLLIGLVQTSGVKIDNPLINDIAGEVSGPFANRNHFALFLAFGCLLAPVWAFLDGHRPHWRGPVALALVLLFTLTILASGSRAGLLLGGLALVTAAILVRRRLREAMSRRPRWMFPTLAAGIIGVVAIFVLLSVAADRAVSIDRVVAADPWQDMRRRGLPIVLAAIRDYFPLGSGLGGFDPVFRMREPFDLLKPTYFNHVHNDFLQVALDAGVPGLLLLLAALGWWAWASVRAWRVGGQQMLPRLGSAILLLIIVASIFDYPAHTPTIMAIAVIAAVWLSGGLAGRDVSALPRTGQHL